MDQAAIKADFTAALGFLKIAHVVPPSASFCGNISVLDIGIPSHLGEKVTLEKITGKIASVLLPERPDLSHKGMFGKLLVVGGSENFLGAPALASVAASIPPSQKKNNRFLKRQQVCLLTTVVT